MSSRLACAASRIARIVVGILALLASRPLTAQTKPFVVTRIGQAVYPVDDDPDTRPAVIYFRVRNTTSQTLALYSSGDCGPFNAGDCPGAPYPSPYAVAGADSLLVVLPIRLPMSGSQMVGNVRLRVWPGSDTTAWSEATGQVTWNPSTSALSAVLLENTFTPVASPHTATRTIAAYQPTTSTATVNNAGTAAATYALAGVCSGSASGCSASPTSLTLSPGASGSVTLSYTAGAIGTGTARVDVTAPARQSGLIETDNATTSLTVADLLSPTVSITPAGTLDPATGNLAYVFTAPPTVAVDACDADGTLGSPEALIGGTWTAATTVTATTVSGCHTAVHATFAITFQYGRNALQFRVSDGTHTASKAQDFNYDDATLYTAQVTVPRPVLSVPAARLQTDTFFINNPGPQAVQYLISAYCYYNSTNNNPACPQASIPQSTVTIGSHATLAVPATYQTPSAFGQITSMWLGASYVGTYGNSQGAAVFQSTTAPVLPPQILAITPANGTTITTSTVNLSVTWCDPDDAITQRVVTWQEQTLPGDPFVSETRAGCVSAGTSTWNNIAIDPWVQTLKATATDAQGHTATDSSRITRTVAISSYKPTVTPKGGYHYAPQLVTAADTFSITNAGAYQATYALSKVCGVLTGVQTISNCTLNKPSVTLTPGASTTAIITYTSAGVTDFPDTLKLIATYTSPTGLVVADTGKRLPVVPSSEVAPSVEAMNGSLPAACQNSTLTANIGIGTIRNSSSVPETYHVILSYTGPITPLVPVLPIDTMVTVGRNLTATFAAVVSAPSTVGAIGQFTITASFVDATGQPRSGTATSTVTTTTPSCGETATLRVSPSNAQVSTHANTDSAVTFSIENLTSSMQQVTYSVACAQTVGACTTPGVPVSITGNSSANVSVNYHAAAAPSGAIVITATGANGKSVAGRFDVTVTNPAPVSVIAAGLNPGSVIARDQCLTMGAGAGAAYECGELRLVHPLPATTTFGVAQGPALTYNSEHAHPRALVQADVTVSSGIAVPDSVRARVRVNGKDIIKSWPWNDGTWTVNQSRRIAVNVDALDRTIPTGVYADTIQIDLLDAAHTPVYTTQAYDSLTIVDRATANPYGSGWWLAGLEQLQTLSPTDSTKLLWIGSDGSTRLYTRSGSSNFWTVGNHGPDRPDTLEHFGMTFRRHLGGGAFVEFNGFLQHTRTVDAHNFATIFAPGDRANAVSSITLPVVSGSAPVYQLGYDLGLLVSVDAPSLAGQPRHVGISYNLDHTVHAITDPDTASIVFGYDAAGYVQTRTTKLLDVTTFAYDTVHKLKSSTASFARTGDGQATVQFCAAESRGATIGTASCALSSNPARRLFTIVRGSRLDVVDTSHFFVNRFGAADTVVDALGHRSLVVRDTAFPMLPRMTTAANQLVTRVVWNTSALPDSVISYGVLCDTCNAITTYSWNFKWNHPTSVKSPSGIITSTQYDSTTGNPESQQVGSNAARRVSFTYDSVSKLLKTVTPPAPLGATTYRYDRLGNDSVTVGPSGRQAITLRDALGRSSLVTTPIDSTGIGPVRAQRYAYDVMDRVRVAVDSAPTSPGEATPQVVQVLSEYDRDGRVTKTSRRMGTGTSASNDIVVGMEYDAAGRIKRQYDPNKPSTASPTTVTWAYTPDGKSITKTTYFSGTLSGTDRIDLDTLGRPMHRSISGLPNDATTADEQEFRYDVSGNLIKAYNTSAQVGRAYFRNGALRSDTLRIANADRTIGTNHQYVVEYTYDRDGKRLTMTRPQNLGLFGLTTYGYDSETGSLTSVSTPEIGTFSYFTGFAGLLDSLARPDGATDRYTYANTGLPRMRTDGTSQAPTAYHTDAFLFDGAGKTLRAAATVFGSAAPTANFTYAGLGGVLNSSQAASDIYTRDALGNVLTRTATAASSTDPFTYVNGYDANSTRLRTVFGTKGPSTGDSIRVTYDDAGNVIQRSQRVNFLEPCPNNQISCPPIASLAWSVLNNYYTGDGRLRASEYTTSNDNGAQIDTTKVQPYAAMGRGVFEQYRYDALGRRVWRRAFRDNYCEGASVTADPICLGIIERTVYDGDQALYEIRQQGSGSDTTVTLEADGPVGTATPDQFGLVAYLHGGGIDQPLAIARQRTSITTIVILHRDWQGAVDFANLADGHPIDCGRLNAASACEHIPWPGLDLTIGFRRPVTDVGQFTWWGTTAAGNQNATGIIDMRARQYDPLTGVFLQEDPLGIAGGLNTYDFGGGDAVNMRDPSGMAACLETRFIVHVISEDVMQYTPMCLMWGMDPVVSTAPYNWGPDPAPLGPMPAGPESPGGGPGSPAQPGKSRAAQCFESNRFSSLFSGTIGEGAAKFLEIGSEGSLLSDLMAYRKKLGGMGFGGRGVPYASGMNRLFRFVARDVLENPALMRKLLAVGNRVTFPTAVVGAFSAGYNLSIAVQCYTGVLE